MVTDRIRDPDIGNAESNQAEQWWCTEAAHRRVFTRESVYWAASVTTTVPLVSAIQTLTQWILGR